jgi:hypothetical protein
MVVVRELLSYLVLALALVATVPAFFALRAGGTSLVAAMADSGAFSSESQAEAVRFVATSEPGAMWLILAAVLLVNFSLIRIWDAVANL